jgi:hypothetical protein
MMSPNEIKFALEQIAAERAVQIVGLHSVVVTDGVVSVAFDVVPGDEPLHRVRAAAPSARTPFAGSRSGSARRRWRRFTDC